MKPLRRFALLFSLALLSLVGPSASASLESAAVKSAHVTARLVAPSEGIRAGEPFTVLLRLEMDEGWHTYTDPPGDAGLPTRIEWELPAGFTASQIQWPEAHDFNLGPLKTRGYEGTVDLPVTITPPDHLTADSVSLLAKVSWLACEIECIPGSADLALELPIVGEAAGAGNGRGFPALATVWLFAFIGGLILNLMPCVLPVLSLKVLGFCQAGGDPRKARSHGLTFTAGVVGSFLLLAGLLLLLRAAGESIGWGFQLQNPAIVIGLAFVFLLLALNLFGLFEIGVGLTATGGMTTHFSGHTKSLADGVLAVIVASPCTAPFMGTALGFSLSQPPLYALSVFAALGLGLAAPYLLLSFQPALLKWLPKPGAWMVTFKKALAFPLLGAVAWLLWVFGLQTGPTAMSLALGGMILAGLAAWIYGEWSLPHLPSRTRSIASIAALLLLTGGFALALSGGDASAGEGGKSSTALPEGWEPFSEKRLAALRSEDRPVFVDFTAAWCITCQWNKQNVLTTRAVREAFAVRGVTVLVADWTRQDPDIARILQSHGRQSVPLYLFYSRDNSDNDPIMLPELLTTGMVLDVLDSSAKKFSPPTTRTAKPNPS